MAQYNPFSTDLRESFRAGHGQAVNGYGELKRAAESSYTTIVVEGGADLRDKYQNAQNFGDVAKELAQDAGQYGASPGAVRDVHGKMLGHSQDYDAVFKYNAHPDVSPMAVPVPAATGDTVCYVVADTDKNGNVALGASLQSVYEDTTGLADLDAALGPEREEVLSHWVARHEATHCGDPYSIETVKSHYAGKGQTLLQEQKKEETADVRSLRLINTDVREGQLPAYDMKKWITNIEGFRVINAFRKDDAGHATWNDLAQLREDLYPQQPLQPHLAQEMRVPDENYIPDEKIPDAVSGLRHTVFMNDANHSPTLQGYEPSVEALKQAMEDGVIKDSNELKLARHTIKHYDRFEKMRDDHWASQAVDLPLATPSNDAEASMGPQQHSEKPSNPEIAQAEPTLSATKDPSLEKPDMDSVVEAAPHRPSVAPSISVPQALHF